MLRASKAAWINTPYRKTKMTQRANVNTTKSDTQAINANVPTLRLDAIRQHLGDIESQVLSSQTFCEIAFEELDTITSTDPNIARVALRLDALIKGAFRNAALIQTSVEAISFALMDGAAA